MWYQYSSEDQDISQIKDHEDLYFDDDDSYDSIDSLDSSVDFELSKKFDEEKEINMNEFVLENVSKKTSNNSKKSNINRKKKYTKGKIYLSQKEQNFKNDYFLIFTNRKKFPKTIIQKIHSKIKGPLNLKPMPRDVVRFTDKYFVEYSDDTFKIIQYLFLHKDEIIESFPDLKKY